MKVLQLSFGGMLSSPQSETQRTASDPVKPKGLSMHTTCKTSLGGFPGDSHSYLRKYRDFVFPDSVVHRHGGGMSLPQPQKAGKCLWCVGTAQAGQLNFTDASSKIRPWSSLLPSRNFSFSFCCWFAAMLMNADIHSEAICSQAQSLL